VKGAAPPYVRSKILRPGLHEASVGRERLVERLRDSTARVWLISAPAGYGKTTVVLEAIEGTDARVGWVSLDPTDNDPVRFWAHLAAAVVDNDEVLGTLLDELDPGRIDPVIDDIMNAIEVMAEPVIFVLDDLHEIHDRGILESLARVVTHAPANLILVLVTRVDPALPIGRLRAHGQLAEIRRPGVHHRRGNFVTGGRPRRVRGQRHRRNHRALGHSTPHAGHIGRC
jgi:LuxR family maltose regulon positive regulatory protein